MRGEHSIAELCRREGIAEGLYYSWSKEFLEAGKRRLAGDTARAATSDEVKIGAPALDRLRLLDSGALADLVRERSVPTLVFCGHLHRNVSGLWAGSPFAALKNPHSQFDLDMAGSKLVRSNEPPGFGVILIGESDIVVNYRDFPISSQQQHTSP